MWIQITTKDRGTCLVNLNHVQTVEAPPPVARRDNPIIRFSFEQKSSQCVEAEFSSLKLRAAVLDAVTEKMRIVIDLKGAL